MVDVYDTKSFSEFNIIEFARGIIKEVDSIRSYDEYVDENDAFQKRPSESRLNAFFRLIGLPMFVVKKSKESGKAEASNILMSPGFSGASLEDFVIENAENVGDFELNNVLQARERALLQRENSIGSPKFNKYMTLALFNPLPLVSNLVDDKGELSDIRFDGSDREAFKALEPLITSYMPIRPVENELSRPFSLKDDRQINSTTELRKPFIEFVVEMRLRVAANAGTQYSIDKSLDQLDVLKLVLTEDDYDKVVSEFQNVMVSGILEDYIISKLTSSLDQLAVAWASLQVAQESLLQQDDFIINIKTSSGRNNVFGKKVSTSANVELKKNSKLGKRLESLNLILAREEAFLSLMPSDDTSDVNEPKRNVVANALIDSFIKLINSDISKIKKEKSQIESKISKMTQDVDKLRLRLDLFTGEFYGLSIPDVIAVLIGLFLLPINDLVMLLDASVIDNMKKDKSLKTILDAIYNEQSIENSLSAVTKLGTMVNFVFNRLNESVEKVRDRSKRSTANSRTNKQSKTKIANRSMGEAIANSANKLEE